MLPKYSKLINDFKGVKKDTPKKSNHVPPKNQRENKNPYNTFVYEVLLNLNEDVIEAWKPIDIIYYFRFHAEREGYRYIVSNYQKELGIIKNIQRNFSNMEICLMIEFLYESEQDYIRKDNLTPSILTTQWVNTIFADSKLWAEDSYTPKKQKSKAREWKESAEDIKIGGWE